MNKTVENIKKALECCSKSSWIFDCEGCPCYDKKEDIQTSECQERLMKNALDLINQQQSEIEKLKVGIEEEHSIAQAYSDMCDFNQKEIERLQRLLKQEENSKDSLTKKCYKDGIKEFADRLKEQAKANEWNGTICGLEIDRLEKEMVGD